MIEHLIVEALEESVKKEVSELIVKFISIYSFNTIDTIIHIYGSINPLKIHHKTVSIGRASLCDYLFFLNRLSTSH